MQVLQHKVVPAAMHEKQVAVAYAHCGCLQGMGQVGAGIKAAVIQVMRMPHVHALSQLHTYLGVRMHARAHTHTHTRTNIHTHGRTHIHTHTWRGEGAVPAMAGCSHCQEHRSSMYRSLVRPPMALPPKTTMLPAQAVTAACSRGLGGTPSHMGLYLGFVGDGKVGGLWEFVVAWCCGVVVGCRWVGRWGALGEHACVRV